MLRPLEGAVVHHHFLPSHMRRDGGFTDPFFGIKNRVYFALRVGRGHRTLTETVERLTDHLWEHRAHMDSEVRQGNYTKAEARHYVERAVAGFELGLERGLAGVRRGRAITPADPDTFLPYPVLVPDGERLAVCFVSMDYPPRPLGGVGRYTHDLARGLAVAGHEAHVVTRDDEQPYRVDFEEGVWVHRFPVAERWIPELVDQPLKGLLDHHASVRGAAERAAERIPFDVVTGSSWAAEPLLCVHDGERPVNVVCVTPMRTIAASTPAAAAAPLTAGQIEAEDALLRSGAHLQPISSEVAQLAGANVDDVVWLGTADHRDEFPRRRRADDDAVQILYVGRLEPRKGVDTLLEAAAKLLRERPHAQLRLVGADNPGANGGPDAWPTWVRTHAADVAHRITFDGGLDDPGLLQAYADCDVFCAPSLYESFGLVHVEAMMMGRPVVGADIGGMRETIVDGETGLLPAPGDADALYAALARLVDDSDARKRMGAAGRKRYESEFALAVAVERHVERFRSLADKPLPLPEPLAKLLARLCRLDAREAEAAATALLDPSRFPSDVEGDVLRAVAAPSTERVVGGLFEALLHRKARRSEVALFAPRIADGESLHALVEDIATSDEARRFEHDLDFLDRLPRRDPAQLRRELTELWLRADDAAFERGVRELFPDVDVSFSGDRAAFVRTVLLEPSSRAGAIVADLSWLADMRTEPEILAELRAATRGDAFVGTAYRLLLGREPDPAAAALRGEDRGAVVRAVGGSEEARNRGIPDPVAERLALAVSGVRTGVRRRLLNTFAGASALRATHTDLADRMRRLETRAERGPRPREDSSADDIAELRRAVESLAEQVTHGGPSAANGAAPQPVVEPEVRDVALPAADRMGFLQSIDAQQTPAERMVLYGLVAGLAPATVLEIGTFKGGSTQIMCAALDDLGVGKIVCVDPFPQLSAETELALAHRATVLTGHSPASLSIARETAGAPFDFALIDGDHSLVGVQQDLEGVIGVLADDAHVLCHDANYHEVRDGIDAVLARHPGEFEDAGLVSRLATQDDGAIWGGLRLLRFRRFV